jgi:hypothetical protein
MPSFLRLVEATQNLLKDQALFKYINEQLNLSMQHISRLDDPLILLPGTYQDEHSAATTLTLSSSASYVSTAAAFSVRYLSQAFADYGSDDIVEVAVLSDMARFNQYSGNAPDEGSVDFVCIRDVLYPAAQYLHYYKRPQQSCSAILRGYAHIPALETVETTLSGVAEDVITEIENYFFFPQEHQLKVLAPHAAMEILLINGREPGILPDLYAAGLAELYKKISPTYRYRDLYRPKSSIKFI